MPLDTTLLDLDRAPTILEMREFFNPYIKPNFRAQDHNKSWYHTEAKIKVEYCPDPKAMLPPERATVDPEKIAIFNLMMEDYWNVLDDTEKKIFLRVSRRLSIFFPRDA